LKISQIAQQKFSAFKSEEPLIVERFD